MESNTKVLVIPHGVQEALILNNYIEDMCQNVTITPIFPPSVSFKDNTHTFFYNENILNYILNYQSIVDEIHVISFSGMPKSFSKNVLFDGILNHLTIESEPKLKSKTLSSVQYLKIETLEQICELITIFAEPSPEKTPKFYDAWMNYKNLQNDSASLSKLLAATKLFSEFLKVTFSTDEEIMKLAKETGLSKASIKNYINDKHITGATACRVFNAVRKLIEFNDTKIEE